MADASRGPEAIERDVCDAKAGDEAALARIQARTGQPLIGKAIGR